MGEIKNKPSGGDGIPKKYYRISGKQFSLQKRENGEWVNLYGIAGNLVNIKRVLETPPPGQNWDAFWSYHIVLEDNDVEQGVNHMVLQCPESYKSTSALISKLYSIDAAQAGELEIGAYKLAASSSKNSSNKDVLVISVKNNGEYANRYFSDFDKSKKTYYNKETGEIIPPVERTQIGSDAQGKPKYHYNSEKSDAFEYEIIKKIYTRFTGKQWDDSNVDKSSASTQQNSPTSNNSGAVKADKLLANIKKIASVEAFLKGWSGVQSYIQKHLEGAEQRFCLDRIQDLLEHQFNKSITLEMGMPPVVEDIPSASEKEYDDDLPF